MVLIVEITSPGNAVADRAIKPQLYAQAGIPHYLRIELGAADPSAVAHRLEHERCLAVARADPGTLLVLTQPIAVTLELGVLAAATRPPQAGTQ